MNNLENLKQSFLQKSKILPCSALQTSVKSTAKTAKRVQPTHRIIPLFIFPSFHTRRAQQERSSFDHVTKQRSDSSMGWSNFRFVVVITIRGESSEFLVGAGHPENIWFPPWHLKFSVYFHILIFFQFHNVLSCMYACIQIWDSPLILPKGHQISQIKRLWIFSLQWAKILTPNFPKIQSFSNSCCGSWLHFRTSFTQSVTDVYRN